MVISNMYSVFRNYTVIIFPCGNVISAYIDTSSFVFDFSWSPCKLFMLFILSNRSKMIPAFLQNRKRALIACPVYPESPVSLDFCTVKDLTVFGQTSPSNMLMESYCLLQISH